MCTTAEHYKACRLQFPESSSSPQLTRIIALFNSWAFCKSCLALKAFYAWLSLDISHQAGFGWDVDLQEKLIMVNGEHDHTHFSETCTATTIFCKHWKVQLHWREMDKNSSDSTRLADLHCWYCRIWGSFQNPWWNSPPVSWNLCHFMNMLKQFEVKAQKVCLKTSEKGKQFTSWTLLWAPLEKEVMAERNCRGGKRYKIVVEGTFSCNSGVSNKLPKPQLCSFALLTCRLKCPPALQCLGTNNTFASRTSWSIAQLMLRAVHPSDPSVKRN